MRSLFGMFCGDIIFETFEDTKEQGFYKQIFLIIYILSFYTGAQNIFVAFVMEGYDRCDMRKEIDNDDPFPVLDNLVESIKRDEQEKEEESNFQTFMDDTILNPDTDPAQGCKVH